MAKIISIIGSTGSIGRQTLEAAKNLGIKVAALSANSNIDLLEKQVHEFKPDVVSVGNSELAKEMSNRLQGFGIEVLWGQDGMKRVVEHSEADTVVTSVVGTAGLIPTIHAIRHKKNIALANKETLVTAGQLVMEDAKKNNVKIFPVDSEHSAIYQCLLGNKDKQVEKIILTASGGPFRGKNIKELKNITPAQALKHPNWSMGNKITIDSATLMNKGLEVIEAKWLFQRDLDSIQVLVHPQSIIHSMVQYVDGSVMAQLGSPDMRIPIQLALTYPDRCQNNFNKLDFLKCPPLTFEEPDIDTFKCLRLAYKSLEIGGTMPAALNAANEIAVAAFLENHIGFTEIAETIEQVMQRHNVNICPCLEDIIEVDCWARTTARQLII
ncbi:1-deoxy-D-xylulose-5-phosphate reductoisomerase [Ruminiclostridium cellulolyticum]|uniref:1-deoxy-D-xylulose 5-phosphate reductoisomerase n=1 Tax=Ruminiclostridium cellulolyticum (strain ATCC 35319 / DSM 5812 / JCM 6584 / H10) TaxID=394503 RepID=DXR_RUMCH|nr:1-deoxy-D-xylulose-5-phosphate reductoisomerase [Ruminiclostridium cellulolyticum]B8I6D9.1 RecName: Full=1-deoxy-D-xylulose 5-phosphate reductoisomerase; Short=DXP reductoisomerase; AltName: Full=1-deoxyxylulose-5-phosphate reductoisomerase; AltName: Full=2-C-methyl-D-erythritol 4-phosphate synthase [Ruminiclostridium cellulolyticum H10]ACL74831.1 1-deoxy-D-xylulose 5-phosphate reductoisomerase [Ruminiclostridium cellulolyticum H10]